LFAALLVTTALLGGGQGHAAAPVVQAFHVVFQDTNPCTGEVATFTFDGTLQVQDFGDHRVVHGSGTVTTSDGYTGMFNRQIVIQGDDVVTRRFFDMEVGPDHERQLFRAIFHLTFVDGVLTAEVANASLTCVGEP
jgi:hypothetical protein